MSVLFHRHPVLLLEAEELVYAWFNGDPPAKLCRGSGTGLQEADAAALLDSACAELDRKDERLGFFFRRYPLPAYTAGAHTCLARIAVFSFASWAIADPQEAARSLPKAWSREQMNAGRQIFSEIMPFGISIIQQEESVPIPPANGLTQLRIPSELQHALFAFFFDYAVQAEALAALLLPVMERLSRALEPLLLAAMPALERMEQLVRQSAPRAFLRERMHFDTTQPIEHIEAAPLFLVPTQVIAHLDKDAFFMLLGVGSELLEPQAPAFGPWGYQALRLLGSPTRMQMLAALSRQPLTAQELKTALGLPHLSAVMRDLSSMQTCHLLDLRYVHGRRQYRVNGEALRILSQTLLSLGGESHSGE